MRKRRYSRKRIAGASSTVLLLCSIAAVGLWQGLRHSRAEPRLAVVAGGTKCPSSLLETADAVFAYPGVPCRAEFEGSEAPGCTLDILEVTAVPDPSDTSSALRLTARVQDHVMVDVELRRAPRLSVQLYDQRLQLVGGSVIANWTRPHPLERGEEGTVWGSVSCSVRVAYIALDCP
jgi:hypothetical protein